MARLANLVLDKAQQVLEQELIGRKVKFNKKGATTVHTITEVCVYGCSAPIIIELDGNDAGDIQLHELILL